MVAVKDGDSVDVRNQKVSYLLADYEENVKRRRLMVLPIVAAYILELFFFDVPAADIDCDVFILMGVFE